MANTGGLVFSRSEILSVCKEYVSLLMDYSFIEEVLQPLAPNRNVMLDAAEDRMKSMFQEHGINPEKAFSDLIKIKRVYASDVEVMGTITFVSVRENLALDVAMGIISRENAAKIPTSVGELNAQLPSVAQTMNVVRDNINNPDYLKGQVDETVINRMKEYFAAQQTAMANGDNPYEQMDQFLRGANFSAPSSQSMTMEMPPKPTFDDELD
eukprot:TRINITY_DN10334_c0_g1_i1.p1 TRINITY_DN10334_c0_g1~~TRINITY_DN10334_c0_g1_i1.p1  ORF type:complete len:211 (-),score=58.27 TRINITY_DN10334_c0_g1_i1:36-668(-)